MSAGEREVDAHGEAVDHPVSLWGTSRTCPGRVLDMSQLVDHRSAPTKRGESLAAAAWPTLAGTRRPPAACLRVGKEVSRKCLGRVSKLACETARRVLVCVKETAAAGTAGKQQEDEGNV